MNIQSIHFERANFNHKEIIFQWLDKPHVREFWDNSQEHRNDILDFMNGRKASSPYFGGIFTYWVGMIDKDPFCFLLTAEYISNKNSSVLWNENCSKLGKTFTIDFCIGNETYLGKGLSSLTLEAFTRFFQKEINKEADTFFIDPDENNPRARRVYEKAGFTYAGEFMMDKGFFEGHKSILMVKKLPRLINATLADYPIIQSMLPYYIYDMYRYCGHLPGWEFPQDGDFKTLDYTNYFNVPDRHAFLIKLNEELAGFALINKVGTTTDVDWNMGEFFILAKFQGKAISEQIVFQIFDQFPGIWEVRVIPENTRALNFWRKVIAKYTCGHFSEEIKIINIETRVVQRIFLKFNTVEQSYLISEIVIREAQESDVTRMVELSDKKRREYEQMQPQFWRRHDQANKNQTAWFKEILKRDDHILLLTEEGQHVTGFIIGSMISAPSVYDPGGHTLMIDDFCVEEDNAWDSVGEKLIDTIHSIAKQKGAAQILVVCGHHDLPKRQFLKGKQLKIVSEWYVGSIK